jgi:hypothetical protein
MKSNYILFPLLILTCNFIFSQSPEILLNGTVSAEQNQIKNVADPTDPGDAINKGYFSEMFESLQSQIDELESQVEDLQSQIDSINGVVKVVISGIATTGSHGSRFYFDSASSFNGEDKFNFSYGNNGWQGSGGNSLIDQGLNPRYIISQILSRVPADGSVFADYEFNSYFSIGDSFGFKDLPNILTTDDYIIINFNTSTNFDVRTNDADLEGEELVVSISDGPESGVLTLNQDYTFSYVPDSNFSGEVQFTYDVTDGINVANATVKILVNEEIIPQENIVISAIAVTGPGTGSRFYYDSVTSEIGYDRFNFSFGDSGWQGGGGNSLIEQGWNPNYIISQILSLVPADGTITLVTEFNSYFSVGDIFSFTGLSNVLAADDYFKTSFQSLVTYDVRNNDADLEGEELVVTVIDAPSSGMLILNENNTLSFTPADDFSGEVEFTYQVNDGENTANAVATIFVEPQIEPQENVTLSYIGSAGSDVSRFRFESHTASGGEDTFDFRYGSSGWQGSGGNSLTLQGLNPNYIISQILSEVPADGSVILYGEFNTYFYAGDSFSFSGLSNILTNDDYIITDFNTSIDNFDVRTNDADLEGGQLIVSLLEGPTSGTLTLNEDGTFSFVPAADFSGEVQFTYEVTDGENVSNSTAIIKVRNQNFN